MYSLELRVGYDNLSTDDNIPGRSFQSRGPTMWQNYNFRLLAFSNYLLMGDKSWGGGVGRVRERSRVSVTIACARAAPKEGVFLALSCQAIRETFVN